jgi:hypothetical protein
MNYKAQTKILNTLKMKYRIYFITAFDSAEWTQLDGGGGTAIWLSELKDILAQSRNVSYNLQQKHRKDY